MRRREHVPDNASSFVGRAADLARIAACFDGGARLVTLVAHGGTGKTRVAARFATEYGAAFTEHGGGTWFCDLTDAADVGAMCGVLAAALGVRLESASDERSSMRAIGRALARRKAALVVLDNVEHLLPAASRAIATWLELAKDVRLLATSRSVLDVPGEHLLPLEPLALPAADATGAAILAADSVVLFVQRARQVRPDFEPSARDLETLTRVVHATDGLPLAIELAAARLSVLTLGQLAERLAAPLEVLVRRGDAGRHASMRRIVLDSMAQLEPRARELLAATSVFRGGFTLECAERVLGEPGVAVLGALEAMVARSLLQVRQDADALRFSCFETIREAASEELRALPDLAERITGRHLRAYAALGGALAERVRNEGDSEARVELSRELDNLLAAHDRALLEASREPAGDGADLALLVALALDPVLAMRGQFELRAAIHERSIEASTGASRATSARPRRLAEAMVLRGMARRDVGQSETALRDLEVGLAWACEAGGGPLAALACVWLGEIVETLGETVQARELFARALLHIDPLPLSRKRSIREAEIRARLGHALRREGNLQPAELEIRRSLLLFTEAGCQAELPAVHYEAGVIALFRGEHAASRDHFERGLTIAREAGARHAEAALSSGYGCLLQQEGRLEEALARHGHAVRLFHEVGSRHREASALHYLGTTFLERGGAAEATKLVSRAFETMTTVGIPRYQVLTAACLATIAAEDGDAERADAWLGRARSALAACATEPALTATFAIHELHVALVSATRDEAGDIVARARALASQSSSDDLLFALRILLARPRREPLAGARPLEVLDEGRGFRLPGDDRLVDLSARAPLRRILQALAAARMDAPGEPLSMDEIVRAGWPGERIGADAATNRVRVALATLRKLGLREIIVTGQGGYLIDPACSVLMRSHG